MIIQINTDNHITGSENIVAELSALIEKELAHYSTHITRVEAHLTDQNGQKKGVDDIRCNLEVRLEGHQPMAASNDAGNKKDAVKGACTKVSSSLASVIGKQRGH